MVVLLDVDVDVDVVVVVGDVHCVYGCLCVVLLVYVVVCGC